MSYLLLQFRVGKPLLIVIQQWEFFPLFRKMFPKYVFTLQELAQAMIMTAISGYEKPVLEVTDIVKLSKNLTH